jgi:hypothetical protein
MEQIGGAKCPHHDDCHDRERHEDEGDYKPGDCHG